MTFDEAIQQHKDNLTKNLSEFGEGHRLNRLHKEIDSNAADYEYYFNAGQQAQQAKVEELQQENLRLAYGNTSYYNQAVKQNEIIDELQKRVDKALELMQKPVIVGEPAKYVCARFKEIEQALKGEGQ
ncbi:hypothetical protein ACRVDH_08740 [Acinetobacter baumannii]|uniref:hypothetical protein n=1 Tax=Acinetobacter baumannii TaxID=470 RepID=UPI001DC8560D|nr:hypothetical protein [Acinetobacter baumannii]EHU2404973.1 hypothetical protein [Acinetobacter baumannii]MCO9081967.1 hypothetical protein [Acinetobacter baumannii]MCO9088088.1 hypothetical protein [Acinetobacter baumannii]MCO9091920.1 hypothetical protein [Acinetobacter baumannii]MCO9095703.1 hypothetical protein [Acinetobacter baumannii]